VVFEAFPRHAVAAAEVATISDADAQVVQGASACVDQGCELRQARSGHADVGLLSSNRGAVPERLAAPRGRRDIGRT